MSTTIELQAAIAEAVATTPAGETATVEVENVTITLYGHSRVNLSAPTGGATITVSTPGGDVTEVTATSWDDLATIVEESQDARDWDVRVAQQAAERAQHRLDKLDHETTQQRAARREAVKALYLRGVSAYRIAQILDLSQVQVARILAQAGVK